MKQQRGIQEKEIQTTTARIGERRATYSTGIAIKGQITTGRVRAARNRKSNTTEDPTESTQKHAKTSRIKRKRWMTSSRVASGAFCSFLLRLRMVRRGLRRRRMRMMRRDGLMRLMGWVPRINRPRRIPSHRRRRVVRVVRLGLRLRWSCMPCLRWITAMHMLCGGRVC